MCAHKFDITGLSAYDLLRKDFKKYSYCAISATANRITYGISTVPATLRTWQASSPSWATSVRTLCAEEGCQFYVVKFFGHTRRKMLVFTTNPQLLADFVNICIPEIGFGAWLLTEPDMRIWTEPVQAHTLWSRKLIQPKIHTWVSTTQVLSPATKIPDGPIMAPIPDTNLAVE